MSRDQNKFTLLKLVVVVVGSARIVRKFVDDILGAPPETNTIFEIHSFWKFKKSSTPLELGKIVATPAECQKRPNDARVPSTSKMMRCDAKHSSITSTKRNTTQLCSILIKHLQTSWLQQRMIS